MHSLVHFRVGCLSCWWPNDKTFIAIFSLISNFVVPWVDYGNYILHFTLVSIVHLHITVWGRRDVACEVTPPKGGSGGILPREILII